MTRPSTGVPVLASRIRASVTWQPTPKEPIPGGRVRRAIGEFIRAGDVPPSARFHTIAVLSDPQGQVIASVSRSTPYTDDGSVQHEGDHVTDRERPCTGSIFLDLSRLPAQVEHVMFAVSSLGATGLGLLDGLHCRLAEDLGSTVIARYDPSYRGPFNTEVLMRLTRGAAGAWTVDGRGRAGACSSVAKVAQFAASAS